jgi:hypothetical protein
MICEISGSNGLRKYLPSEMLRRVVWQLGINVWEEHTSSIFCVEEKDDPGKMYFKIL